MPMFSLYQVLVPVPKPNLDSTAVTLCSMHFFGTAEASSPLLPQCQSGDNGAL
jgi:hypothetical protein